MKKTARQAAMKKITRNNFNPYHVRKMLEDHTLGKKMISQDELVRLLDEACAALIHERRFRCEIPDLTIEKLWKKLQEQEQEKTPAQ